MQNAWTRTICRLLVALTIWMPYQIATAGMIGTDQAVATTAQMDRTTVVNFLTRADVSGQLQSMGIDPSSAGERVAALSDQEVRTLAGRINSLPAGGLSDAWAAVLIIVAIGAAVWWFWRR